MAVWFKSWSGVGVKLRIASRVCPFNWYATTAKLSETATRQTMSMASTSLAKGLGSPGPSGSIQSRTKPSDPVIMKRRLKSSDVKEESCAEARSTWLAGSPCSTPAGLINCREPSVDPETTKFFLNSGLAKTKPTRARWPSSVCWQAPVWGSQIFTVPSRLPERIEVFVAVTA